MMITTNTKGLMVGFDLCDDYSQISCCNIKIKEPESVYSDPDKTIYRIPTVMYKDIFSGEWYYGSEAVTRSERNLEPAVHNFIKDYEVTPTIMQNGTSFEKKELLSMFVINALGLVKKSYPNEKLEFITFTVEDLSVEIMEDLKSLSGVIGVNKENIQIIGHREAYAYYALCQKSDLWQRGTGMFEYNESGLMYYGLSLSKRYEALVVSVSSMDLSAYMSGDEYKLSDGQHLDSVFTDVAARLNVNGKVSTFYLAGDGFNGQWVDRSLKLLCNGSRVFIGQNLYSRGACYNAMTAGKVINIVKFKIICEDTIARDVSFVVNGGHGDEFVPVVKAGDNYLSFYYNAKVMLKNTDKLYFKVVNPKDGASKYVSFQIGDTAKRESNAIRYSVDITMIDGVTMEVSVKDDGFGSFFTPSQRSWKNKIHLDSAENDSSRNVTDRYVITKTGRKDSPFYLPISGIRIYSIEELAYYVFNNIYTIDEKTFSDELITWLDNFGGNPTVAQGLRSLKKRDASLRELVKYILFVTGIYDNNDWSKLNEKIANIESQNPTETAKIEADNYVRYGRNREAIKVYTQIIYSIEHNKAVADGVTNKFKGNVYHNLGTALTRMLDFKAAEIAFLKAYELNRQEKSLESYLWSMLVQDKKYEFKKAIEEYRLSDDFTAKLKKQYNDVKLTSEKKMASYTKDYGAYIKKQKNAFRE